LPFVKVKNRSKTGQKQVKNRSKTGQKQVKNRSKMTLKFGLNFAVFRRSRV